MKILLLNPPFVPEFIRSSRWAAVSISGSNWFPIYLAYCTGLLEKNGHETKLVDAPVDKLSHEDVLKIAEDFSPDVSVIYISTVSLENDIEIGEKIKKLTDSYIVLVGPWCSINPENIMEKIIKSNSKCSVDSIAIGEFDYTILDIVENKPYNEIDGLVWKSDNKIIYNSPRKPLTTEQINDFPFVTDVYRRHLNIHNYCQAPHLNPFIDLFTGRGCSWGKCTFCLWPHTINKGAPYRRRDIGKVIEELKFVKEKIPYIKEIFIQDDTLPKDRARELSEAIIENNLDIIWSCYCRADTDINTLKVMKDAGCRLIHVGYESSNQQILNNINKGTTVSMLENFTDNVNRIGLLNHADFIIGLPGETKETIMETVKWAKSLKVDSYQFTIPKPYPQTPFYQWLENNGFLKDGWANYPHLSSEEIIEWTKWSLRETNMNPKYIIRMLKKPTELKRLVKSAIHVVPNLFQI